MTRKTWIGSDQFDSEAVARHLQSRDSTVVREGDNYYPDVPRDDAAADDTQANDIADKIVGRINALGRIHDPNFRPLKLSRYTDDTAQNVVVGAMAPTMATARMRATATLTRPDGTVVPDPPSPWPDYLALTDKEKSSPKRWKS